MIFYNEVERRDHMSKQVFVYKTWDQISLKASFFPSLVTDSKKATILYLHGGGFLFGDRDDLPKPYLNSFLENGFSVLTFDYPFSPETPLTEIIHCLEEAISWYLKNCRTELNLSRPDFYLFGRSAGGYLASILTTNNYEQQLGLIRFYGYHHFEHPDFTLPSSFYHRFPKVPPHAAQQFIQDQSVVNGALEDRFPIYLSARQYGNWLNYLGTISDELTVNSEQLKQFPPAFIVHCTKDPDVPVAASRQLSETVEQSTFLELDSNEHDFDRTKNPIADNVYQKLICWLIKQDY